mgnify:CR=1 FL=1
MVMLYGLQIFFEVFEALLRKGGMLFVLGAGFVGTAAVGPVDVYRGVVIGNAAFAGGIVDISALVAEFGYVRKDQEAVGKTFGDVEHLLILGAEGHAHPLAIGGGAGAAVYSYVVDLSHGHPDQLALGVLLLEVQAPEDTPGATALVVLDEGLIDARGGEVVQLVGLHEVAPVVTEDFRLNDDDTRNFRTVEGEVSHYSRASFRYRLTASCQVGKGVKPFSTNLDLSNRLLKGRAALLRPYSAVVTGITLVVRPYCL